MDAPPVLIFAFATNTQIDTHEVFIVMSLLNCHTKNLNKFIPEEAPVSSPAKAGHTGKDRPKTAIAKRPMHVFLLKGTFSALSSKLELTIVVVEVLPNASAPQRKIVRTVMMTYSFILIFVLFRFVLPASIINIRQFVVSVFGLGS